MSSLLMMDILSLSFCDLPPGSFLVTRPMLPCRFAPRCLSTLLTSPPTRLATLLYALSLAPHLTEEGEKDDEEVKIIPPPSPSVSQVDDQQAQVVVDLTSSSDAPKTGGDIQIVPKPTQGPKVKIEVR